MTIVSPQLPGYRLGDQLYAGNRTLVYRAIRETDNLPVIIKLLRREHPSFNELVQFRNQYTIAVNLNSPSIIQPYNLEPYGNGYVLVMEDFGGIALTRSLQAHSLDPVTTVLTIALQLADSLHYLYQQRVIHKDIKPANILMNPTTQQVKLTDFSIASLLSRETQEIQNPNLLEGTLAYMSPEQTGRMNRGIDYRTDFYSLGVTLYELLTGQLPFRSLDPLELVHCHLAKEPVPPHEVVGMSDRNEEEGREGEHELAPSHHPIPPILSQIILKLMAKNAEDRYQSALGLKHDLEICLKAWQATREIPTFVLAQQDLCDRFKIPEKLYGRKAEVSALLAAFDRVSCSLPEHPDHGEKGHSELVLVTGFSGIGKTAVVNEVHKPIVRKRGYFIKGKYDQFQRNIPFSAIVQALRALMGQLLSERDEQLQQWRNRILRALGENGQVLIEVIPELEQMIGPQPAVPVLTGIAAQNRFNLLFQAFIQVLTTSGQPLVMFLDDLQWADSASLVLMKLLLTEAQVSHLLLIGAYRDHEVFPGHPLMLVLESLEAAIVHTLTLRPLLPRDVNTLVAETLSCTAKEVMPLAQLVYQKTHGNPFFINQFLKALHRDGCLVFNQTMGHWECDLAQVKFLAVDNDVAAFMAQQLRKLPLVTQTVLQLAACLGNQFDLATLAIVANQTQPGVATALWSALKEELILPRNDVYKFYQGQTRHHITDQSRQPYSPDTVYYRFLHDRVQQAAYFLIPESEQPATHLKIGRRLRQNRPLSDLDDQLFAIVNQLNRGEPLITDLAEREDVAMLNLAAVQKAKNCTAYRAAMDYAKLGLCFLREQCWQTQYDLALSLHNLATEVAYLCGEFKALPAFAHAVLRHATSLFDKIEVYNVQILAYTAVNQPLAAVELALQILHQLGTDLPESPSDQDIQQTLAEVANLHPAQGIASLVELPHMADRHALASLQILNAIFTPCYAVAPRLIPLISATGAKLSMTHGSAPLSVIAYAGYGMLLCGVANDLAAGYEFGQLALNLLPRFSESAIQTRVMCMVAAFVLHWRNPLQASISTLQSAYQSGVDTGDLQYTAWSYYHDCQGSYLSSQELASLERKLTSYEQALAQLKQDFQRDRSKMLHQVVLNLLGQNDDPCQVVGYLYDEVESRKQYRVSNNTEALFFLHFHRLLLCYWFGHLEQAWQEAQGAEQYLTSVPAQAVVPVFYFYDALVQLARYPMLADTDQQSVLERVQSHQARLTHWAGFAPENYQHKVDLVAAEMARVLGQKHLAIDAYDRAIAAAKAQSYSQDAGLANELAAQFYLDWTKPTIAQSYLMDAYYCYSHWGAKAKILDLENRYPDLLSPILDAPAENTEISTTIAPLTTQTIQTTGRGGSPLDLMTVIEACQTLASEIELPQLLTTLLHIMLENAGADRGAILVSQADQLSVVVQGVSGEPYHLSPMPVESLTTFPLNLIRTVQRTQTPMIVNNVAANSSLLADSYLVNQAAPKSLLCQPILHQEQLVAMLYLENHLITDVFTRERLQVLNLLCTQAAISLEHARLYHQSQNALKDLQESQQLLRNIIDNIPQIVLWKDNNSTFLGCNANAAAALNLDSPGQIIGKTDGDFFFAPEEVEWYRQCDRRVMDSGQAELHLLETQQQADGSQSWLDTSKIPLRNTEGDVMGIVVVITNITDLVTAEAAMQQKSQDLEQALQNLQQAQLQIVQNEKMASLGNLVAGIAHEINNPVGFLNGSINNAQDYVHDLLAHLDLYQHHYPQVVDPLQHHAEEIDLEFMCADLPNLLDSMQRATDRIKSISTNLRTFSRADHEYKVSANLHEGLDSTLLILRYRLRASEQRPEITVVKGYGDLPVIDCFPGQINQVFMNILANAIDVFDEAAQQATYAEIEAKSQQITIQTLARPTENQVEIRIRDNGQGMSEEVQAKIFDHLFTTKAVGKGTGLGLAITRQIVEEKHGGRITVNSSVGQGTEFILVLPV